MRHQTKNERRKENEEVQCERDLRRPEKQKAAGSGKRNEQGSCPVKRRSKPVLPVQKPLP